MHLDELQVTARRAISRKFSFNIGLTLGRISLVHIDRAAPRLRNTHNHSGADWRSPSAALDIVEDKWKIISSLNRSVSLTQSQVTCRLIFKIVCSIPPTTSPQGIRRLHRVRPKRLEKPIAKRPPTLWKEFSSVSGQTVTRIAPKPPLTMTPSLLI